MLPASDLSEILANLSALNLQPNTTAQILAAVLAPLLRSSEPSPPNLPRERAGRPQRQPRRAARSKPRRAARRKRKYARHDARDRALAALRAKPEGTSTELAKIAKCSPSNPSTIVNARRELAKEQRRTARKRARQPRETMPSTPIGGSKPAKEPDRRERAQRFLREQLGGGPKPVTTVEAAAAKAHGRDDIKRIWFLLFWPQSGGLVARHFFR